MPSTTVWYCCSCGFGPCNDSLDYFCPSCQERRCYGCTTSKISNRYNYELPGEAEINPWPQVFTAAGLSTNTYNINTPPRPSTFPHQHLGQASLALASTELPPTCLDTGHQLSTDCPTVGEILQHGGLAKRSPDAYYYCCQCNDGPKLYANQPVCTNCEHHICRYCKPA